MEHLKSIYVRLENTLRGEQGVTAHKALEQGLAARYPNADVSVEMTSFQPYDKVEITNVPLTIVKRAVEDAQSRNTSLSARIVPMMITSRVTWNVEMSHPILLIGTAEACGEGDCLYTPLNNCAEPVDALGKALDQLRILHAQVTEIVPLGRDAAILSRSIMSILQEESLAMPKH